MEPKQAYEILKNKTYKDDAEKQALLDVIKTDPEYAYEYAKDVMKDENFWDKN